MFKNPLWHPGLIEAFQHYCLIHGLNLFVGGALFDKAEKFSELYAERTKKAKNLVPHDVAIRGVSFLNLQWVIYEKATDMWYSPKLHAQIEKEDIDEFIENKDDIGILFDEYDGTRFIV